MSTRTILFVAVILVAGAGAVYSLRPDDRPAVDFSDDLRGPASLHFTIPFDKFTLTPEGLLRSHSDSGRGNGVDRPVVRTRSAGYLSRDFVFEVDITIPPDVEDILFVGVGDAAATTPFNEPGGAFGFRIHHMPENREVRLSAMSLPPRGTPLTYLSNDLVGVVPASGSFTIRLERAGDEITGSIPGQDGSARTVRVSAYPSIPESGRGFLYLANTAEGSIFSNVKVRPRT